MNATVRQRLIFLAKLLATALIFWWIFNSIDLSLLRGRADQLTLFTAAICVAALILQSAIAALRLRLLATILGAAISLLVSWNLTLIGLFFNQVLPSTIGGDAVKMWMLAKREAWSTRAAVHCVLIDRAMGLIALITVIGLSLPWVFGAISDGQATAAIALILIVGVLGFSAFLMIPKLPPVLENTRIVAELRELQGVLRNVVKDPIIGSAALLCGASMYVLNAALVWFVADGVGIDVDFVECLAIVPTALLISFVPVSIAGWGLREGAMIAGFAYIGMPATDALFLSVVLGLSATVVGLVGGAAWLATKTSGSPAKIGNMRS